MALSSSVSTPPIPNSETTLPASSPIHAGLSINPFERNCIKPFVQLHKLQPRRHRRRLRHRKRRRLLHRQEFLGRRLGRGRFLQDEGRHLLHRQSLLGAHLRERLQVRRYSASAPTGARLRRLQHLGTRQLEPGLHLQNPS